ncbi:MAG: hypothetical protein WA409_08775, partial [Candidatus Binatus sp.]
RLAILNAEVDEVPRLGPAILIAKHGIGTDRRRFHRGHKRSFVGGDAKDTRHMTLRRGSKIVRRDDGDDFVAVSTPRPRRYGADQERENQIRNTMRC